LFYTLGTEDPEGFCTKIKQVSGAGIYSSGRQAEKVLCSKKELKCASIIIIIIIIILMPVAVWLH